MEFNTRLLHGYEVSSYEHGATQPAINQSSSFAAKSAQELEDVFNHRKPGCSYTRVANPSVDAFERRLCEIEDGAGAVSCSSGLAAIAISILNLVETGDEIIVSSSLFGGSLELFAELKKYQIKVNFVRHFVAEEIEKFITPKTKLIFGEIITNTSLEVMDVDAISRVAHKHDIPLIVDATTASPYLVQTIKIGADIVVHSTSKYINGFGNAIGGIIIDSGKVYWNFDKYPTLASFREFRNLAYLVKLRRETWRNLGACTSPFNSYLNIMGLETLGLRMKTICSNAYALASSLATNPKVKVNYPTLESSPFCELAARQFNGLGGGIVTLRVGSKENAFKVMDRLKYATIATNIGDVRTLVIYPRTTICRNLSSFECNENGIFDDLIRISVGIEDQKDLIEDFNQALADL